MDQRPKDAPTRPVLKYHGGKWRIAPWIISYFPAHRVYVEPFGGGGSVLLRKGPAEVEVYNDLDGEIVNVFRALRSPESARRLRAALELTPYARSEFELGYRPARGCVEQARRTIVRSWLGFGSTAASGRRAGFQRALLSDKGRRSAWLSHAPALRAAARRLRSVVIEQCDAFDLFERYDSAETLFYVDPPYVPSTWAGGVYRHELSAERHQQLAQALNGVRGQVVLSGYPSALYDRLYAGWKRHSKTAFCAAGRYGSAAREEVVWVGPPRRNCAAHTRVIHRRGAHRTN